MSKKYKVSKNDIEQLLENRLDDSSKKLVLSSILKNPKLQKEYQNLKAIQVAKAIAGSNKTNFNKSTSINFNAFLKYAAILIILFSTSYYSLSLLENEKNIVSNMTLVTTAVGENRSIILSDGTKITLNSNSALSYPTIFNGEIREVVLKGEAFFNVAENKEIPFIVKTNEGMDIKVLGTSFNVKSYPEDGKIETTLVSGKVEVVERKDNKTVFLYPSQRATYVKKADQLIIDKVNVEKFVSWKEGKLIYDETPLKEVLKGLERMYNLTFEVDSKELLDYKYNGVFDNLTVEEAINLIELSSPIKCIIKNKHVKLKKQK